MLPVNDPKFNLKEICKQLLLLEDHLSHPGKRCSDCIRKHLLMSEALAEEALSLGAKGETQRYAERVAKATRQLSPFLEAKGSPIQAAGAVRALRKELVAFCHETKTKRNCLTCSKKNPQPEGPGITVLLGVGVGILALYALTR